MFWPLAVATNGMGMGVQGSEVKGLITWDYGGVACMAINRSGEGRTRGKGMIACQLTLQQ